jgi:hypothetical protein
VGGALKFYLKKLRITEFRIVDFNGVPGKAVFSSLFYSGFQELFLILEVVFFALNL